MTYNVKQNYTNWLTEQGVTSQQTHYRSYRGWDFTSQMTQPTASKHWRKLLTIQNKVINNYHVTVHGSQFNDFITYAIITATVYFTTHWTIVSNHNSDENDDNYLQLNLRVIQCGQSIDIKISWHSGEHALFLGQSLNNQACPRKIKIELLLKSIYFSHKIRTEIPIKLTIKQLMWPQIMLLALERLLKVTSSNIISQICMISYMCVILIIQNVNFVATIIMFGVKNQNDGTVWLLKSLE